MVTDARGNDDCDDEDDERDGEGNGDGDDCDDNAQKMTLGVRTLAVMAAQRHGRKTKNTTLPKRCRLKYVNKINNTW